MDFTPIYENAMPASLLKEAPEKIERFGTLPQRATVRPVRCGGYLMDQLSGRVAWRGETLDLPHEDCELLGLLLRRAGQILSREAIASALGVRAETVDLRINRLRVRLIEAGVTSWLPRAATGVGYILWR